MMPCKTSTEYFFLNDEKRSNEKATGWNLPDHKEKVGSHHTERCVLRTHQIRNQSFKSQHVSCLILKILSDLSRMYNTFKPFLRDIDWKGKRAGGGGG